MQTGLYVGKGFDLMYRVTKTSDEEYWVVCMDNDNIHYFKGNKLHEQITNFLNNHELINIKNVEIN